MSPALSPQHPTPAVCTHLPVNESHSLAVQTSIATSVGELLHWMLPGSRDHRPALSRAVGCREPAGGARPGGSAPSPSERASGAGGAICNRADATTAPYSRGAGAGGQVTAAHPPPRAGWFLPGRSPLARSDWNSRRSGGGGGHVTTRPGSPARPTRVGHPIFLLEKPGDTEKAGEHAGAGEPTSPFSCNAGDPGRRTRGGRAPTVKPACLHCPPALPLAAAPSLRLQYPPPHLQARTLSVDHCHSMDASAT